MNINLIFRNMIKKEKVDFNLEDAKNGAEVITDCGFSVKILSYDLVESDGLFVGVLTIPNDVEIEEEWKFNARISYFNRGGKYVITFNIAGKITGIVKTGIDVDLFKSLKINHFKKLQRDLDEDSFQIKILREKELTYTEKVGLSAQAMVKIAGILETDKRFGGIITDEEWKNDRVYKYCIEVCDGKLDFVCRLHEYHLLSFHTQEQSNLFFGKHEDLVKQYLMLD